MKVDNLMEMDEMTDYCLGEKVDDLMEVDDLMKMDEMTNCLI